MNGQTHWVQVIGDGVTQATVTYDDLLRVTLIQFHLKDGRRVEIKSRGTLATLCSVSNRYQVPRAYVQLKDSTGYASSDVEVYGDDSFCGTTKLSATLSSAQGDPQTITLRIWPLAPRQDLLGEAAARQKADAVTIENLERRLAELEDEDEDEEEEDEEEDEEETDEETYDSPPPDALIEVLAWLTRMAQRK